jgi:hypothetical protein
MNTLTAYTFKLALVIILAVIVTKFIGADVSSIAHRVANAISVSAESEQ